ncbi:MAG: DUF1853 family protein [Halioglobus sp.]|nr:DUF1853 family protein [Halioglobus sp.]
MSASRQCNVEFRIYPYQTQVVRDLAWACFAPPLVYAAQLAPAAGIRDLAPQLTPARRQWLEHLDRDAEPLLAHLAGRPTARLGLYFEQLWHFFLHSDPQVELLAHNLPVRDTQRTVGEFDCLYYCRRRQRYVHAEFAVKYYLGVPAPDGARDGGTHWLGPDPRDRLDRKLDQMVGRQIRLGETTAGQAVLASLGIADVDREIVFRGQLYQPASQALPLPVGYNRDRSPGAWTTPRHFASRADVADRYLLLPRLRWLSPAVAKSVDRPLSPEGVCALLKARFAEGRGPAPVALLDTAGVERERFFIAPETWPGEA